MPVTPAIPGPKFRSQVQNHWFASIGNGPSMSHSLALASFQVPGRPADSTTEDFGELKLEEQWAQAAVARGFARFGGWQRTITV